MKTTINVGKEIRNNTELKVSKEAVEEYIDRVISAIDPNILMAECLAKEEGRKTIMKEDIEELFGKKKISTVHEPDNNNRCF